MGRQTPLDLKGDPLGTPVPTEPHCCLQLPTPAPRSRCEDLEPEFKVRPIQGRAQVAPFPVTASDSLPGRGKGPRSKEERGVFKPRLFGGSQRREDADAGQM